ncbi:MAG: cation-transporting P-type ATPase [Rhodospirillales bacterium]|nr:MAG: cation-transporting P-type ATPase [Rhodospirillales bacterium]
MNAESDTTKNWHAQPLEDVFKHLDAETEGLGKDEAQKRLEEHGRNRLRPPEGKSAFKRFLLQFHNVLIYVLIGAAVVTALMQHWLDAAVIMGVVIINALIGFIQEGKAEKALDSIRKMLSLTAVVRRDGERMEINAEEVVPGDIVEVRSGDRVPADLRLFQIKNLQVQEAVLTGESVAVQKDTHAVDEKASLGDRACIAFSGTLVTYGQGTGIVVETADRTEIGRIGTMLSEVEKLTTPLLRKLAQFGRWLTVAILTFAAATFAFGVLVRGFSTEDMFLAAVGIAVAAIPEGLPAIMTIALAIGVQRMAGRNAIIRKLPAVETLGSVTVICSDKTGTLTRNEMTVQSIATANHLFGVTGVGYAPRGSFTKDDEDIHPDDHPVLSEITLAALLCNDATLRRDGERWTMEGDPTEGALITAAAKAGRDPDFDRKSYPRTDIIPFESEHRFMATLHHDHEGNGFIYVKGAPERVLEMCARQRGHDGDTDLDIDFWNEQAEEIAARGQRLLAIAVKYTSEDQRALTFDDATEGLTLLGLCGLIDPPREEAIESIRQCQEAGIRVKMITGDHAVTARAIGRELGLVHEKAVIGKIVEETEDEQLRTIVDEVDVFARVSPEHKLRLVTALQANREVTAMTGDGVNDAPALKRADIGIAMGIKGTEAAKEASEMVLVDDNFASIAHAVEEGRGVYDNLRKSIMFILPTNGGQSMTIIGAVLAGQLLPITPVQILWVNMVTAVTMALALAFEPIEAGVMKRKPRPPEEPLLTGFLLWRILFVSAILFAGTLGLFLWETGRGVDVEIARTIAVNTLVFYQIFYLFNTRHMLQPVMNREGLFGNHYVLYAIGIAIVLQMLFTYAPPFQLLFSTQAIGLEEWARILMITLPVFFLVELEKLIMRQSGLGGRLALD